MPTLQAVVSEDVFSRATARAANEGTTVSKWVATTICTRLGSPPPKPPRKPPPKPIKMAEVKTSRLIDDVLKDLCRHGALPPEAKRGLVEMYTSLAGDQPWRSGLRQEILHYLQCLETDESIRTPDAFVRGCLRDLECEEAGRPPVVGSGYADQYESWYHAYPHDDDNIPF